jgi:predicted nucleic acid-binding protein
MSPEMRTIPKDSIIYIDANIFIYDATDHANYGQQCKALLHRVERNELKGITSTITINEVLHRLTLIELSEKEAVGPGDVIRLIKENSSVLAKASDSYQFIEKMHDLPNLDIVPYSKEIAFLAVTLAQMYFLMSNDATHVATMRTHGIHDIATNDPDFERVDGITIWKPRMQKGQHRE